jgi:hypothetical protein
MNKKFSQIPTVIHEDIIHGKLIGNDLLVYNYLAIRGSHGKPFFLSNKEIGLDLGGMSYGKISASLNRLSSNGHISRKKTCNKTQTTLKTLVMSPGGLFIKGVKQ